MSYSTLTEHQLFEKIRNNDQKAWRELWRRYEQFVKKNAMRYSPSGHDKDDAISAAIKAFYEAAKRYSEEEGSFASYLVWWIKREVLEDAATLLYCYRLPRSHLSAISRMLNGNDERKYFTKHYYNRVYSIDIDGNDHRGSQHNHKYIVDNFDTDSVCRKLSFKKVVEAFKRLNNKELKALLYKYGFYGDEMTYSVIGESMGISTSYASHYVSSGLNKVREELKRKGIKKGDLM
jgi:RNA polymerase sigma factor (sigma-70 family)